jgi:hypothetical protein
VTGAGAEGVDGMAVDAKQDVPPKMTIYLHAADHRRDGGTQAQLAADGWRDATFPAYPSGGCSGVVTG